MKFIFIILFLFSVCSFAQNGNGNGGGGGPSITLRYNNVEIKVPAEFEDLLGPRTDRIKRDVRDHFLPNSGNQFRELVEPDKCKAMEEKSAELCRILKKSKTENIFEKPLDLEIKGAGVVDLQTFKDETPKSLWREENDKILIDSRVPIINWQDDEGTIHDLD